MSRIVGTCAVMAGLALLSAGCNQLCELLPGICEPEETGPVNTRSDSYDPIHHRLFFGDCAAGAIRALDLATGSVATIASQWPWPHQVCPADMTLSPDSGKLYSFVWREVPGNDPDEVCTGYDLVEVNTATGAVAALQNLYVHCCDDCGPGEESYGPLVDAAHGEVLHLYSESDPNFIYLSDIVGVDATTAVSTQRTRLFELDCSMYEDEEDCFDNGPPEVVGRAMAFDPGAPDSRALVLMSNDTLVSADFTNNTTSPVAVLQKQWGNIRVYWYRKLTVDLAGQRAFVAGTGELTGDFTPRTVVVAVDLATGTQSLLYDGSANAAGERINCYAEKLAYDSQEDRVLVQAETSWQFCNPGIYAVATGTGALERL